LEIIMKVFRCITTCTFGSPPRLYEPGDALVREGACPMHFEPGVASEDEAESLLDNSPKADEPQTLADVNAHIKNPLAEMEQKMADEPCTVAELADKIGADVAVIKEISGKRAKSDKLTAAEVTRVKVALAKASEG